jgi:putative MFS transporter
MYPTPLRNTGSGLCYGAGRLANIAGPFIVSGIYGAAGYAPVFVYIAACWAIVAITVAVLGPRSGGAVLEELQETEQTPTGRFTRAPAARPVSRA